MAERTSKLVKKPFKNSLGQTIEVGDKVVFVASGRANKITIDVGVFDGVNVGIDGWQKDKDVSLRVSGVPAHYRTYKKNPNYKYIPYGQPGYPTKEEYYLKDENDDWIVEEFHELYRVSTLPSMRVFKFDTQFQEVKNKL